MKDMEQNKMRETICPYCKGKTIMRNWRKDYRFEMCKNCKNKMLKEPKRHQYVKREENKTLNAMGRHWIYFRR
jgi:ribosomal protein L37AE/L43A